MYVCCQQIADGTNEGVRGKRNRRLSASDPLGHVPCQPRFLPFFRCVTRDASLTKSGRPAPGRLRGAEKVSLQRTPQAQPGKAGLCGTNCPGFRSYQIAADV